jgi:hypothetical protein
MTDEEKRILDYAEKLLKTREATKQVTGYEVPLPYAFRVQSSTSR